MTPHSWMIWTLLLGFLWTGLSVLPCCEMPDTVKECFKDDNNVVVVVAERFYGYIDASKHWTNMGKSCVIFVNTNVTEVSSVDLKNGWPQIEKRDDTYLMYLSKWHMNRKSTIYILRERNCSRYSSKIKDTKCVNFTFFKDDDCKIRCVAKTVCDQSSYNADECSKPSIQGNDKYQLNITAPTSQCLNCDNPVKKPEQKIVMNETIVTDAGGNVGASQAVKIVSDVSNLIKNINGSSAEVSLGEGISGVVVKQTEPADVTELSFAYVKPNESINIIEDRNSLDGFSRSVTVPKEAFKRALSTNVTEAFAAVIRFTNLAKDENNSTVLGNEVLAVEMGASIANLTDTINVNFKSVKLTGTPSCQSWNGNGSKPNWTDEGCQTISDGDNITCRCTHLTFFAILLTPIPVNETISGVDLQNLTIITQVGCAISMFFLSVVLFMHFLLRKTKANKATLILIHLVTAMFMLNFTFLINSYVANLQSDVGCKIMAAAMHYFMLATFTWFAVHAFHLLLQLYMGGKIVIRRYILKVSVTSWVLPSVVGIILLIVGKYGQQTIYADNPKNNVAMCWITDHEAHFIVNIGYYVIVFLFTFTTFIVMLSWLFCLRRIKTSNSQMNQNGRNIITVMGLCCMLGISWGCAFFAYGVLQIPSYYIFTIVNSFQGLFLFIYYYNSSHAVQLTSASGPSNLSSTSTLKTALDTCENPYENTK